MSAIVRMVQHGVVVQEWEISQLDDFYRPSQCEYFTFKNKKTGRDVKVFDGKDTSFIVEEKPIQ